MHTPAPGPQGESPVRLLFPQEQLAPALPQTLLSLIPLGPLGQGMVASMGRAAEEEAPRVVGSWKALLHLVLTASSVSVCTSSVDRVLSPPQYGVHGGKETRHETRDQQGPSLTPRSASCFPRILSRPFFSGCTKVKGSGAEGSGDSVSEVRCQSSPGVPRGSRAPALSTCYQEAGEQLKESVWIAFLDPTEL